MSLNVPKFKIGDMIRLQTFYSHRDGDHYVILEIFEYRDRFEYILFHIEDPKIIEYGSAIVERSDKVA